MTNFETGRLKEISYHEKLYKEHDLYEPGTWLANPVKVVTDTFDLLHVGKMNVLDLGCGVGRNSIPIAQKLREHGGLVYCVDLIQTAIDVLTQNAVKYEVKEHIVPIVADAEHYMIPQNIFDYIVACSCLEHVSSEMAFATVIKRMQDGTTHNGINCILMSAEEQDTITEEQNEGLIELNLETDIAFKLLRELYHDWEIMIERHMPQEIDEIKNGRSVKFKSNWLTFVARKRNVRTT